MLHFSIMEQNGIKVTGGIPQVITQNNRRV